MWNVRCIDDIEPNVDIFIRHEILILLILFVTLNDIEEFCIGVFNNGNLSFKLPLFREIRLAQHHVSEHIIFTESSVLTDLNHIEYTFVYELTLLQRLVQDIPVMFPDLIASRIVNRFPFFD